MSFWIRKHHARELREVRLRVVVRHKCIYTSCHICRVPITGSNCCRCRLHNATRGCVHLLHECFSQSTQRSIVVRCLEIEHNWFRFRESCVSKKLESSLDVLLLHRILIRVVVWIRWAVVIIRKTTISRKHLLHQIFAIDQHLQRLASTDILERVHIDYKTNWSDLARRV